MTKTSKTVWESDGRELLVTKNGGFYIPLAYVDRKLMSELQLALADALSLAPPVPEIPETPVVPAV